MSDSTNGSRVPDSSAGTPDLASNRPGDQGQGDRAPQAGDTRAKAPEAARKLRDEAQRFEQVAATIPRPFTSHNIVGSLAQTQGSLADSLRDLAQWHENAQVGAEFEDSDGEGGLGAKRAAERLQEAALLADRLQDTLHEAMDENGSVRWRDSTDAALHAEQEAESSWTTIRAPSPAEAGAHTGTGEASASST